jgi:glucose-6-phosphate 1-dehydrogenase
MSRGVAFFIFGGTGDLAKKKLYPVMDRLVKKGKLKNLVGLYALSRTEENIKEHIEKFDPILIKAFKYMPFDVTEREHYHRLEEIIKKLEGVELIFYLALPPQIFESAIVHTGSILRHYLNPRKIVIEKPFGFDLDSAKKLNFQLKRYFTEDEIYRIDHFLGKVAIQNLLSFRFSNYIFEGIWNKNFIDNVQISALESVGLEGRAGYYDRIGALRDMVQNHLLQILSFLAMEPPAVISAERIRDEKVKVLASIRKFGEEEVDQFAVRGVYRGYREELGRDSHTETFAAVKLLIDNFRWEGVPFYLRTGKKLREKKTQIVIVFKEIPGNFSRLIGCTPQPNKLVFDIAPSNRVRFFFQTMPPQGFLGCSLERSMELSIDDVFEGEPPEAYETLLEDIIEGDQTLFIREDESELAWEIIDPIIKKWAYDNNVPLYDPGTEGPREADKLIWKDGREWILL